MPHPPTKRALATLAVVAALGLVVLQAASVAAQEPPTTTAPPATEPPTTVPPPTEPPTTAPPTTEPPTTAPPTTAPLPPNMATTTTGVTTAPVGGPAGPGSATGSSSGPPGAGSGPGASGGGGDGGISATEPVMFLLGTARPVVERMLAAAKPMAERLFPKALVRRLARTEPVAATGQAVRLVADEVGELEPATVAGYLWLALAALLTTLAACTSLWWAPRGWPTPAGLALTAHRRVPRRGWAPLGGAVDGRHLPGRHLPGRSGTGSIGIDVESLRAAPAVATPVFSTRTAAPER